MQFTYYYVNNYLTKAEIKKINKEFDKAPQPFHKQAPTVKSSVATQTGYYKIQKIKELYDLNLLSKKEYDSITKILVKDLVDQK